MPETLVELVARISADASALKKALGEADTATAKTAKSIGQKLDEIGHKMSSVGKQMSMKLTAPIVGVGAAAFKMSGDFDQAFRKTNVMLGASAEEAVNYKKRILEISSATGKSAGDVADAFYTIVSAGHRGADSLDILEAAMRGAIGGAADAESTVEALTKAMNVFELEGVEGSSKAMDVFFGIVDSGLLSFEQMSNSFPRAASNAAGLGISIEETGATLATLTKVLGSTEQAATATDAIFRLLISPSEAMVGLFEQWGVKSGPEAIEKFGGLTGVLEQLKIATSGEVTAIRELFASDEAMKGILPLLTSSYDDYGQAINTVTDSQGRANEAFIEMAQGPGFQLQQTFTIIKNASIELGDTLASTLIPILKTLGEKVEDLIKWWQSLSDGWQKTIIVAVGVLAAIGPMLIVFGQMAIGISGLITLFKALKIFLLTKLIPTIIATTTALWAKVTALFAILAASGPAGWVALAAGIALIGVTAVAVTMYVNNTKDSIDELTGAIEATDETTSEYDKTLNDIQSSLQDVGKATDDVSDASYKMGNAFKETSSSVLKSMADIRKSMEEKTIKSLAEAFVKYPLGVPQAVMEDIYGKYWSMPSGTPGRTAAMQAFASGASPEQVDLIFQQAQQPAPPLDILYPWISNYQGGGIVSGPIGQPQLAMVHGGETVIPANESTGNIVINFTQPVFFDREDTMNRFVDMIRKGIQRQDRLRFGGAYYG